MSGWDRYWFGDVEASRPWLLLRGLLLMLAFDAWLVMVEHGGRYGVGDFNVSHFLLLDLLQPTPTPAVYVGVLLLCGLLAFALALTRPVRWMLGLLTALYTWSWSTSMLDSYQHHYLLSLLLVSCVFFPSLTAEDVLQDAEARGSSPGSADAEDTGSAGQGRDRPRLGGGSKKARRRAARRERRAREGVAPKRSAAHRGHGARAAGHRICAWAYGTFGASCAIVYGYTAVAKMEDNWRQGYALRQLTRNKDVIAPIEQWFVEGGAVSRDGFWELLAACTIALQVVIAAGYALAVRRDTLRDTAARVYCGVALVAAWSFHLGAELLELRIGWFSYYMLFTAAVFMLPAVAIRGVVRFVSWPGRRLVALWRRWTAEEGPGRVAVVVLALATLGVAGVIGSLVDLPGSRGAALVCGVIVTVGVLLAVARGRLLEAQGKTVALAAAALTMWAAVSVSTVRFDYYRLVGGDARRRGELETALAAYVKANRYAPEDDDRKDKEMELRRRLGRLE